MGVFFYTKNVALAEDLSVSNYTTVDEFYFKVDESFQQVCIMDLALKYLQILKYLLYYTIPAECIQLLDRCPDLPGYIVYLGSSVLAKQPCLLPGLKGCCPLLVDKNVYSFRLYDSFPRFVCVVDLRRKTVFFIPLCTYIHVVACRSKLLIHLFGVHIFLGVISNL